MGIGRLAKRNSVAGSTEEDHIYDLRRFEKLPADLVENGDASCVYVVPLVECASGVSIRS